MTANTYFIPSYLFYAQSTWHALFQGVLTVTLAIYNTSWPSIILEVLLLATLQR